MSRDLKAEKRLNSKKNLGQDESSLDLLSKQSDVQKREVSTVRGKDSIPEPKSISERNSSSFRNRNNKGLRKVL